MRVGRPTHSIVMCGLVVPRLPLGRAPCSPKRDGRDKPGHDQVDGTRPVAGGPP
jgi:hypothetical protein